MTSKDKVTLIGIGLDNDDGHTRITRGDGFRLRDGSQETHERMIEVAIKFHEDIKGSGRHTSEMSGAEISDRLKAAQEKVEG